MFGRDAFMGFSFTFDAILQFHATWRQEPCDGEDSSQLQICSSWPIEVDLLSKCVDMSGHELFPWYRRGKARKADYLELSSATSVIVVTRR